MTLREKLSEADKLLREMIDHLDNDLVPKSRKTSQLIQESGINTSQLSDTTIRQQAAELVDANRFNDRLYEKLDLLLASIEQDVDETLH